VHYDSPMTNAAVVHVLRHVAFEDAGILTPLLVERGYAVRVVDPTLTTVDADALADGALLVILGAPVGVMDEDLYPFLTAEKHLIRRWLDSGRPTLGICLGAQLIAEALGAEVTSTGHTEIGYAPVTLTPAGRRSALAPLAAEGSPVPVLHWHGDQFGIPPGATRLAQTPGFPNQAFSCGDSVLGLQFHLEADHTRIEHWLVGHAAELAAAGIDARGIREDARRYGPALVAAGQKVFGTWLDHLPDAG